jgi:hypothetical protein
MFMSLHEIVDDIMLYKLSEGAKQAFRKVGEKDLVHLHHTFGQTVRFEYQLWNDENPYTRLNYVPIVVDNVDVNPKHPDNFSNEIIRTIWKRMQ